MAKKPHIMVVEARFYTDISDALFEGAERALKKGGATLERFQVPGALEIPGAIRLAKDLGPGHTIVTVLCDSGTRYQSKLFNAEFLRSKKLPVPAWLERKTNLDIPFEKR